MTEAASSAEPRVLKAPPLLLGAALVFWGWQSGLPAAGAVMAVILESARFVKARWDLSEDDFRRIMTICTLLALILALYALANNEEGGSVGELFRGPAALHNASLASLRTSTAFFRWLPMILFLMAAAQAFSARETVPWTAISMISRRRRRLGRQDGGAPGRGVNVSYPYFMVCLFAACIHTNEGGLRLLPGECALIVWALWLFRRRLCRTATWALAVAAVAGLGYFGQHSIGALQRLIVGYNVRWLAHFFMQKTDPMHTMTAIGQIGELKLSRRIVIRLQTERGEPPPTYLREASYRAYYSQKPSWHSGTTRSTFQTILPETNLSTWVLLPKATTASVHIACYLDGGAALLPLPTTSARLEDLHAYTLQENREGAVLAEGPGLVIFNARYGPGATMDSPPDRNLGPTNLDLLVPANEVPALDRVISEIGISNRDEARALQAVYGFFQDHFAYSLWQGKDKLATTNETSLARFLLTSRRGHCEYFATATVLLLRELKIPARAAVGYAVHEQSGQGYVVRERDAHAWCLVWNGRTGAWEDFDTTPASWVAEEDKRRSALQWLSDFGSWLRFQISKLRWGQTHFRQYLLWSLVPVLGLLLYQTLFRRGRRRQRPRRPPAVAARAPWPGLDSDFYRLEQRLVETGWRREPGESLSDWLRRFTDDPGRSALKQPLQGLLVLHYRHRFDPKGLGPAEREALRQQAAACLESVQKLISS